MKVMLLAAGRGERMEALTETLPKPLLEAGGRPLIVHQLERLAAAGFDQIVINLGWRGERLRAALGNGERYGVRIRYSEEGWPALETGGGLQRALPLLGDEPFLAVNADLWTDFPYQRLRGLRPAAAHLVLVPNPVHHPNGDFVLDGGLVHRGTAPRLTFSGIGVYAPALFAGCTPGRYSVVPLLERAMQRDEVSGERYDGGWFDVGTPQRLAVLDARLRTGKGDGGNQ